MSNTLQCPNCSKEFFLIAEPQKGQTKESYLELVKSQMADTIFHCEKCDRFLTTGKPIKKLNLCPKCGTNAFLH